MIKDSLSSLRSRIPEGFQNATYQWVCSRRGRITIVSGLLLLTILGLLSQTSSETLSYGSLSGYYQGWRSSPSSYNAQSPLLTPSKTTLELESGNLLEVPNHLKKSNPSFHVLLPNPDKNKHFCKASLSSMLLNYPPPTLINGFDTWEEDQQRESAKVWDTYLYLKSKNVQDDDIVLIADGNNLWFQLPSDVLIRQYEELIHVANFQLQKKYGLADNGEPLFRQTTVWGALKTCHNALRNEPACIAIPDSPLPKSHYGPKTDTDPEGLLHRPKYLNAAAAIGPAKEFRAIFERANEILNAYIKAHRNDENKKTFTYAMALASVYGEQEYARMVSTSSADSTSWHTWLSNKIGDEDHTHEEGSDSETGVTLDPKRRYEFSIGLDYGSVLFQAVTPSAPKEFAVVRYDTDASRAPPFPTALVETAPPFSSSAAIDSLSPNKKHLPYIEELKHDDNIDLLPDASSTYANLSLIINTYNPSLPVAIFVPPEGQSTTKELGSKKRSTKINYWESLWFKPISRAFLRHYLRSASQGVLSFHNAAVGGDRSWDTRGGAGGVWTSKGHWMEWGMEVCEEDAKDVFGDGKGKWLKENEKEEEKKDDKKMKRTPESDSHRIRKRDMYGDAVKIA